MLLSQYKSYLDFPTRTGRDLITSAAEGYLNKINLKPLKVLLNETAPTFIVVTFYTEKSSYIRAISVWELVEDDMKGCKSCGK